MRAIPALCGMLLALGASGALACGYCVEDKIASAYDHAIVAAALAQKHHVAYFHIDGPLQPGEDTRRAIAKAVEATPGVDKGSVRVAVETMTVSLAFDPSRSPLVSLQAALDRRLAVKKLSLMPLRIIEKPAELKTVRR